MELYGKEEQIYREALQYLEAADNGEGLDKGKFARLVKEYGSLLDQIRGKAMTDFVGVYSRGFLDESLHQIMNTLSRSGGRLSVLMIGVEGDVYIKPVATTLKSCLKRSDDFLAIYDKNEFVAVLPSTGEEGVKMMANRMLKAINNISVDPRFLLSLSIGATTGSVSHTQKAADFIDKADEALLLAKKSGHGQYLYLSLSE